MRATVFFKDGHTEEVIYSNYFLAFPVGIHDTDDLYFDTKSESYKLLQNSDCEEVHISSKADKLRLPKIKTAFYKYHKDCNKWFVDESVERVEFYTDE
jgi:hypothetical protein